MNNHVFVPVTDDLIYNHPEQIEGPLIPYSAGMECSQWLAIEINPEDDNADNDNNEFAIDSKKQMKLVAGKLVTSMSKSKVTKSEPRTNLFLASSK